MHTPIPVRPIVNKPRKVIRNAFILALLLVAAAIVTGYSGMDGMKGGYALILLLGFLAMSSFITAMVYIPRAREFDKLVSELNPLAHWIYTEKEWALFIQEDLKENLAVNKATLRLVIIVSLVVLAILLLLYRDSLFILIIAGIIGMLTAVAFVAPRIRRQVLKKGNQEALLGERSAYIGGTFQTWTQLDARLIGTDIYEEGEIPVLHIIYEFPTLQATQQEIVRIPVPAGKMEEARGLLEILRKQIK